MDTNPCSTFTVHTWSLCTCEQNTLSNNTTQSPWKTILVKLRLQKGDDGRGTDMLFWIKKEDKVRWGNALIFVKRSTLIVDCTKNMLKVPDKETSLSFQHNEEGNISNNKLMNTRSTPIRFTLEMDGNIVLQQVRLHLRSGSRTTNGSRIKVGIIGDLQPELNSKILKVEITSTWRLVATTRSDSDSLFSLVQVVVFRLPTTFNSLAIDGRCELNTFSHSMYRREHCVHTAHCTDLLHAHAWLKLCVPKKIVIPSLVSRHVSRPAQHTQHFDLIFTVLCFSFVHRLRPKVDHVRNTLRRLTRPWRWWFYESRTAHKLWATRTVDNPIVTEQESVLSAEESQIPEIEYRFSLPYNQSLLSSTQFHRHSQIIVSLTRENIAEREAEIGKPSFGTDGKRQRPGEV